MGPFAIDSGLVRAVEPVTIVRIHNTNTGKIIVAEVQVRDGRAVTAGDYAIAGVPGTGARIDLDFLEPAGSVTGALLPTGSPTDTVELADGRRFRVSIVDAANPIAFMLAVDLGLSGTEAPTEIEQRSDATAVLEEVRGIVAEMIGIVPDRRDALRISPGLPKVGMVAPSADYRTRSGSSIGADEMDLHGRLMSMQTAHRSYMTTGAICTAAAATIPGTLVHEVTRDAGDRPRSDVLRIANPYGIFDATVTHDERTGVIRGVKVGRTARHILDGVIHVAGGESTDRD